MFYENKTKMQNTGYRKQEKNRAKVHRKRQKCQKSPKTIPKRRTQYERILQEYIEFRMNSGRRLMEIFLKYARFFGFQFVECISW